MCQFLKAKCSKIAKSLVMWEKGCYNKNRMQCKSSRFAYFLRRNCVNSFQELVQSIDWGSLTDALLRVLGVFFMLDGARDLSRSCSLCPRRSDGQARAPLELKPTAPYRLVRLGCHAARRLRLGKARAGRHAVFQKAEAGYGHHSAGGAGVESAAGDAALARRAHHDRALCRYRVLQRPF